VGPRTTFFVPAVPPAATGYLIALRVALSPSYAERLGNPLTANGNTTRLICALNNNPADPSGRDRFLSAVDVQVLYQDPTDPQYAPPKLGPDPRLVVSSVIQMHADPQTSALGVNLFAPRAGVARDFQRIRQAEQIPVGAGLYDTLIVDDAGVKEINNATWSSAGAGLIFEFTAANYLEEMQGLKTALESYGTRPPYPTLIDETSAALREAAYQSALGYATDTVTRQAANGQVDFLPVAAWKNRAPSAYWIAAGTYTIANAFGDPYLAAGTAKSEVFEVDPRFDLLAAYRAGKRIVKWDLNTAKAGQSTNGSDPSAPLYGFGSWPHFIVPDPSMSLYPWMAGASYGLKQPQGVDRY